MRLVRAVVVVLQIAGLSVVVAGCSSSDGNRRAATVVAGGAQCRGAWTFCQDFSASAGSGINAGLPRRVFYNDPCWRDGCGNQELERYRDRNCFQDGHGALVMQAEPVPHPQTGQRPYTSCRQTMIDWQQRKAAWWQRYGMFEARMKVPATAGLWPGFWMVGQDIPEVGWPSSGEIDVMEGDGGRPGTLSCHVHGAGLGGGASQYGQWVQLPGTIARWHDYALTWRPTGMTWRVDGRTVLTMTPSQAGAMWTTSLDRPMALILQLAVGGTGLSRQPSFTSPQRAYVDYVRVKAGSGGGRRTRATGSGA